MFRLTWSRFSPQRYTGERLSGEVTHLPPVWQAGASLMANSTEAGNPGLESAGTGCLSPGPSLAGGGNVADA